MKDKPRTEHILQEEYINIKIILYKLQNLSEAYKTYNNTYNVYKMVPKE